MSRPPGVKIATLAQSPVFGGRVKSVDDTAAKAVKGVRQIVRLDDAVAVVADHMGAAKKGLAALVIEWDDGPHAKLTTSDVLAELEQATLKPGAVAQNIGDADAGAGARRDQGRGDLSGSVPGARHDGADELHGARPHRRLRGLGRHPGHRRARRRRRPKVTGLPLDKVVVHNHLIGGGFGRRLEVDGVCARRRRSRKQVDGPVKVVWTREEDIQHDMYRPMLLRPAVRRARRARASRSRGAIASPVPRSWRAGCRPPSTTGSIPTAIEGAIDLAYALPNLHVEYVRVEPPGIPTAFWRSVGPSHNVFVVESFMDELAAAAKQDPVAYRLALLDKTPRAKAVLALAAEKPGWGGAAAGPAPAAASRCSSCSATYHGAGRRGRGGEGRRGSRAARRVRGRLRHRGQPRHRPGADGERASMFGITAALYGEITLKDGRVEQTNFDTYHDAAHERGAERRGAYRPELRRRRAAWARPEPRRSCRPSPTRSSRRPASGCESCRSITAALKQRSSRPLRRWRCRWTTHPGKEIAMVRSPAGPGHLQSGLARETSNGSARWSPIRFVIEVGAEPSEPASTIRVQSALA